jgi:hypothetical protein
VLKPRDPILALVTVRVNVSALIGSALSGPSAFVSEDPELMPGVWEKSVSFSSCLLSWQILDRDHSDNLV